MKKVYTVSYREDGKWQVIRKGNNRPTRVFDVEEDAVAFGDKLALKEDVVVQIIQPPKRQSLVGVRPEYKEETEPLKQFSVEATDQDETTDTIDTQQDMEYYYHLLEKR
jgi:Uncharacterized protein conserved in bacteria (DUF2188)